MQLLQNYGVDINSLIEGSFSPLYVACFYGDNIIIQHLLNFGADINLCIDNGANPLYIAREKGLITL